jgi:hypothetical protein
MDKSVKWNAVLVSAASNPRKKPGVEVVVDLETVSALKLVTSISATIEFSKNSKVLGVVSYSFPLDKSGSIQGGQKIKHTFDITDPRFSQPGVLIKPLKLTGTVDEHIYVYQEQKDPDPTRAPA